MNGQSNKEHLVKILSEAVKNRIYGSVEIYFEEGRMTQITQRIISKIQTAKPQKKVIQTQSRVVERISQEEIKIHQAEF